MSAQTAPSLKLTDYETELDAIDRNIAELDPRDCEQATRLVYRLYHRSSLTGDLAGLDALQKQIEGAMRTFGPAEDLYLLKANLNFKLHRLVETERALDDVPQLADRLEGRALRADLLYQRGRYNEAKSAYEALIHDNPTWDNLARLAYYKFKMGDFQAADTLYLQAQDELTAKEMRSFAWLELQRGVLQLTRGQYEPARLCYQRAARAYSGHWLIDEHMAELLAAEECFEPAIELYRTVIARVPKPELQQALGELYLLLGRAEEAAPWTERALAAYLESAQRGEVHYYHHLADFYCHVRENGAEAAYWARKDLALRDNHSTQAALAWALHLQGESSAALAGIRKALSSSVQESELYYQAAMIHSAAGLSDDADRYLRIAEQINPHYQDFHVHH